ncbi:MAG TPA: alpha/beta fold hydrolase [Bacillota bacterium]|nr:alpha/beta fold hydrolase [Bacillota bacterium]
MTEYESINDYELFDLGDVVLHEGTTLRGAKLAYKTHGTLNENKDNVIVFPTYYSGTHKDDEYMIGPGMALDPEKYFIIQINQLGNGLSSSPNNMAAPYNQGSFPNVTTLDNVKCQHRLVTEHFGIETIKLVCGYSMGAQQTFQWAAEFPDMVERMAPWCGTASTTKHNYVFLEAVRNAIMTDAAWQGGYYDKQPERGIRTLARVYAGWGVSQPFYYEELYLKHGFSSLEDFLVGFWEGFFLSKDANCLLSMAWTWQHSDIGMTTGCDGDREKALSGIKAKAMILPGETDLYFLASDIEREAALIEGAEFRVVPGVYGHFAGIGFNEPDTQFINDAIQELLDK